MNHRTKNMLAALWLAGAGPALAGPADGPLLEADSIVIRGDIRGEVKNGRQGGGGSLLGIINVGANSTAGGRVNVNGIVQEGRATMKVKNIVLDTTVRKSITNNSGDLTVSGITQIGPK
jgi:hypothetical protein